MGKRKKDEKGYELAYINPGWIKGRKENLLSDAEFLRLLDFYVIQTPCDRYSYCSVPLTKYGWSKNVWRTNELKNKLFDVASLVRNESFMTVNKTDEMKGACEKIGLKKDFQRNRNREAIAVYKPSGYNEFTAVLFHLRNAFAHGRFTVYPIKNEADVYIVFEDGKKGATHFQVRARMVLRKSTLLKWICILKAGKLLED